MATLDGVDADLRRRIERMLTACPRLWIESGLRTRAEQQRLYTAFLDGGTPANRPGTSMHEKGLAVDVGAQAGDAGIRRDLAKQYGLAVPHAGEPWHMELDPRRAPLKVPPPAPRVPVKEEAEVTTYASECRWPDGSVAQVFPDGAVKCFGAKSFGSIMSLKDEFKRSFTRAACIRPVNPQNSAAGYIVGNENGDEYTFNEDARKFFK